MVIWYNLVINKMEGNEGRWPSASHPHLSLAWNCNLAQGIIKKQSRYLLRGTVTWRLGWGRSCFQICLHCWYVFLFGCKNVMPDFSPASNWTLLSSPRGFLQLLAATLNSGNAEFPRVVASFAQTRIRASRANSLARWIRI